MSIVLIFLGFITLFICIKLQIENRYLKAEKKEAIQEVKLNIYSIQEKQDKIMDKVLLNKAYNQDLNTEIKELSKEVLELHQDFIKEHTR